MPFKPSLSVEVQPSHALGIAADGTPAIVLAAALGLALVLRTLRRQK